MDDNSYELSIGGRGFKSNHSMQHYGLPVLFHSRSYSPILLSPSLHCELSMNLTDRFTLKELSDFVMIKQRKIKLKKIA